MENPQAERVKNVAALAHRRVRQKSQRFLVEGPQAVREALKYHLDQAAILDAIYLTQASLDRHPDLADLLDAIIASAKLQPGRKVYVRLVSEAVLAAMSTAVTAQGILAVCFALKRDTADYFAAAGPHPRLVAALCQIQDPGNAGTILRAADAAGADLLITSSGTVDLYNPKTVRAATGSHFHLPVVEGVPMDQLLEQASAAGLGVLAADGYGQQNLHQLSRAALLASQPGSAAPLGYDLRQPTVWLFGNEAQGLGPALKKQATATVAVPLYGQAESLNVGMAASICLFASAQAQHLEGEPHG